MREADPLDLVETIREGLLEPDLTVRFANRSFCNTFAVAPKQVLLAIEDVTEHRRLEHKRAAAHERIAALLQELGHRIKNSLQIIVSMVSLQACNHKSGEGKAALERVSHRIAALGRPYPILGETNSLEEVESFA